MNEARRINIYTPPGYAGAPEMRYPVLYLLAGGLEEDFVPIAGSIDASIRSGAMRPLVVVGIENTERRRDMTGPTQVPDDLGIAPRVGGSVEFRRFIRDDLRPAMDARLRGDGQTAILGESLSGLFVVETFLESPGLFDVHVAFSPSLWWNDQSLVTGAAERLRRQPQPTGTLFVARLETMNSSGPWAP